MERERDIEKKLKTQVERMGGLFFKFTSPGNDGVPDRIAILPGGEVWFLELKTDKGKPSNLQIWQMQRLTMMGCNVEIIQGMEDMVDWCVERRKEMELNGI